MTTGWLAGWLAVDAVPRTAEPGVKHTCHRAVAAAVALRRRFQPLYRPVITARRPALDAQRHRPGQRLGSRTH